MKLKILVLVTFSFIKSYSQELTINETIDYLNSKIGSASRVISLEPGGEFKLTEYKEDIFFKEANLSITEIQNRIETKNYKRLIYKTYTTSINDIDINKTGFVETSWSSYGDFFSKILCTNGNAGCIHEIKFNMDGKQISSDNTSILDISFKTKDINDKIYNAFKYLISLAKNDIKYQNVDEDPFSSKNYNNFYNIVSTKSKIEKISLTNENGVYKIWVEILGIRKFFILDTGASELSISMSVEKELISKNLIKTTDYLEPALYKIADGSIVLCRRVKLKQVKVGNITVENVIASVGISETPLLLGRNFLDHFQKWTIDNNLKILILEN